MSTKKIKVISKSASETMRWGQRLGAILLPGDVVVFVANLGTGKTTLIQGLARKLNIKDDVLSPTFVMAQTFKGMRQKKKLFVHHLDFYRMSKQEILDVGIQDYLLGQGEIEKGIVLIEWGNIFKEIWPPERIEIHMKIKKTSLDREIELIGRGPQQVKQISKLEKYI